MAYRPNHTLPPLHTLPAGHPKGVVWVGLLNARSRSLLIGRHRFRIRAPQRLSRSSWQYARPIPRAVAPELLSMTTKIEHQPDKHGKVHSAEMRMVPLFEITSVPPNWRQRLADSGVMAWVEQVEGQQQVGPGLEVDEQLLRQSAQDEAQAAQHRKVVEAVKAGVITEQAARELAAAGLIPQEALAGLPTEEDQEAESILSQDRDFLVESIEHAEAAMLDRLAQAEEALMRRTRGRGARKYVLAAIEKRRKHLGEHPEDDQPDTVTPAEPEPEPEVPALDPEG